MVIGIITVFLAVYDSMGTAQPVRHKPAGPQDFRGVKWGSSEAVATELLRTTADSFALSGPRGGKDYEWSCEDASFGRQCRYQYEFGKDVQAVAFLNFVNDSFQSVDITWPQFDFAFVLKTFETRFGKASEIGTTVLQNAMGATFNSTWFRWRWPGRTLIVKAYGSNIERCAATLKTDKWDLSLRQMEDKDVRDAASKLTDSVGGERAAAHHGGAQQPQRTPITNNPQTIDRFASHPDRPYIVINGDDVDSLFSKGVLFLDARRTSVYEEGHIPGARPFSVWEPEIDDKVNNLVAERISARDLPIVIYCSGGDSEDSHVLAQKLWNTQFNNIYVYEHGFPDWQKRGRAISTGPNP